MFFLTRDESGPKVVLVQVLLRLKGYNVSITGEWNGDTMRAIDQLRTQLHLSPPTGSVTPQVFFNLIQNTKLKVVDSIDAAAGRSRKFAERDMRENGIDPLLMQRHPGEGVAIAVQKILARANNHKIASLRILGHGNRGTWVSIAIGDPVHTLEAGKIKEYEAMKADYYSYIDYSHYERLKPILSRLRPQFANFGNVELNCCTIGKNKLLLQKLADTWNVPVTGGLGLQHPGGSLGAHNDETWGRYDFNKYNEKVCGTFAFEGDVFTAYPNGKNLRTWAADIDASIINLPKVASQIQHSLPKVFGK